MSPSMVADLTLQGIRAGRFFIITHPKVTEQRVQARYRPLQSFRIFDICYCLLPHVMHDSRCSEILENIRQQPDTGY